MNKVFHKVINALICIVLGIILISPINAFEDNEMINQEEVSKVVIDDIVISEGRSDNSATYSQSSFYIDLNIQDHNGIKSISLVDENKVNQIIQMEVDNVESIITQIIFDETTHQLRLNDEASFIQYDGSYIDFSKLHIEVINSLDVTSNWYFIKGNDNLNKVEIVSDKPDDKMRYPIIYDHSASIIENLEIFDNTSIDGYYGNSFKMSFDVSDESRIEAIKVYGIKVDKSNNRQSFCLSQSIDNMVNSYHFKLFTSKKNGGINLNLQEEAYAYLTSCDFSNDALSYIDLSQLTIEILDIAGNKNTYYLKRNELATSGYELVNEIVNQEDNYPIIIDDYQPIIIMNHYDDIVCNSNSLIKGYDINYEISDNYQLENYWLDIKINDEISKININKQGKISISYDKLTQEYFISYHDFKGEYHFDKIMNRSLFNNQQIEFSFNALDECNNKKTRIIKMVIDDKAPIITKLYAFDNDNVSLLCDRTTYNYQLFTNQAFQLGVIVEDKGNDVTNMISSIQYALADEDNTSLNWQDIDIKKGKYLDDNKQAALYQFTMPNETGFIKTRMVLKIIDIYGNQSEYYYSCGMIYQSKDNHLKNDNVIIDVDDTNYVGTYSIGKRSNVELYNGEVDANIKVSDLAGIKAFSLYLNDQKQDIDELEMVEGYKNLIVSQNKKIRLKEGNNQELKAIAYDNINNKMVVKKQISIDTSVPKVMIDFDIKQSANYYNQTRIAKISVSDANIDDKLLNKTSKLYYLKNGMMKVLSINNFQYVKSNDGEDVYEANISFEDDGNYLINNIFIKDYANNEYQKLNSKEAFVIDKKAPIVKVKYDKQGDSNKYYQQPRVITFDLYEQNFDNQKIKLLIYDENHQLLNSNFLQWNKSNGVYQSSYCFNQEGSYSFELIGEDKAGNTLKTYQSSDFCLDFNDPKIDLNLKNKQIYADNVDINIEIRDDNLDYDKCKVNVYRDGKSYNITGLKIVKQEDKMLIKIANIEKLKQNDGLYNIEIIGSDKAKRTSIRTISFTINRFGSSFHLLTGLDKIMAKPKEIVIDEYNVSPINNTIIRINHNYLTTDLNQDKDYVVEKIDDNMYHNRYYLKSNIFKEDGNYTISLISIDEAGHHNYSKNKQLKLELMLDQSKPIIHISNIEANHHYNEKNREVIINLFDNSKIKQFRIWVNGNELLNNQYNYQESSDRISFRLNEENYPQRIEVLAIDEAGNEGRKVIDNIIINQKIVNQDNKSNGMIIIALIAMIIMVLILISKCRIQVKKY